MLISLLRSQCRCRTNVQRCFRLLGDKALSREGCEYSEVIKKSRFVCFAKAVTSVDQANFTLEDLKKDSKANHYCWAYRIGQQEKYSDDGEPSGSAGLPILSAIKNQELQNAVVVVLRYFGGVKLGMGGLVRAYGGAARKCLAAADYVELCHPVIVEVTASILDIDKVYSALQLDRSMLVLNEDIVDTNIKLRLQMSDESNFQRFEGSLNSIMKGSVTIKNISNST